MAKRTITAGDRVKLTGAFLRNTGQHTGSEGLSVWTVTGFSAKGEWAITDQKNNDPPGYYSDEELADDPTLGFRRIHVGNLRVVQDRAVKLAELMSQSADDRYQWGDRK